MSLFFFCAGGGKRLRVGLGCTKKVPFKRVRIQRIRSAFGCFSRHKFQGTWDDPDVNRADSTSQVLCLCVFLCFLRQGGKRLRFALGCTKKFPSKEFGFKEFETRLLIVLQGQV